MIVWDEESIIRRFVVLPSSCGDLSEYMRSQEPQISGEEITSVNLSISASSSLDLSHEPKGRYHQKMHKMATKSTEISSEACRSCIFQESGGGLLSLQHRRYGL